MNRFFSRYRPWTYAATIVGTASLTYYFKPSLPIKTPFTSTTKLKDLPPPVYCTDSELLAAVEKLKKILGPENVFSTKVELDYHTRNEFNPHEPKSHEKPKFVIYPQSTEQVLECMKILNHFAVPVVPFSGGTSLEGHFYSTRQGVVMDTSKMNKILQINYDDLDVQVQAGVNWVKLNEELEPHKLMIGLDCGPDGLISGMVNTNASGVNASKYGAMISNVISLTVVLPDGTIVKTKQRPRKSSSGYSLTQLFVGSEGTLGIVTEATLKLHSIPKYETVLVGQFPTLLDSTKTVSQLYRAGIQPTAMELLDNDMMHCINYSGYFTREWSEVPTLFFKIGGLTKTMVDEQVKVVEQISKANNCENFLAAKDEEEAAELFHARKNAFYAILNYGKNEIHPDVRLWVTDIAVPLSKLPPVLNEMYRLIKESGLQSIILAHAGDANFHCDVFYQEHEKDKCEALINKMMERGLANEGTASGEHGIGNGKRNFLVQELGEDAVDLMRKIKLAVDPKRIMNPDKIFKIDPNDDGEY